MTQETEGQDFDFLFGGEEIDTTVERAAVRVPDEGEPARVRPAVPPPAPPSPAESAVSPESAVSAEPLEEAAPAPVRPSSGGSVVPAVACPAGHPNPPGAGACRYCGQPLGGAEVVEVPRPSLGVLRFSSGQVVPLTGSMVVGRSPSADAEGGDPTRELVRVPSPGARISRSHVALTIDGWDVLVTDLHSGNGTTLVIPGQEPHPLTSGETVAVPVGATVWLAQEVSFAYTVA